MTFGCSLRFVSGREIDEKGQIVAHNVEVVKTLAANAAALKAKKENPYLAHRSKVEVAAVVPDTIGKEDAKPAVATLDPRLKITSSRDQRAKKSFHFVEEGTYVKEADKLRQKEERKVIAGYSSGRKQLDREGGGKEEAKGKDKDKDKENKDEDEDEDDGVDLSIYGRTGTSEISEQAVEAGGKKVAVPPPADGGVVPVMEW